jgi:hypothetical protein
MTHHSPTAVRRSLFPQEADTWTSIAERELSDAGDGNISLLQSWNMHVFARAAAPVGSPRVGNPILPSDVIFLEPPASH